LEVLTVRQLRWSKSDCHEARARIQVNASDYSTSDLAYVASQGNGFIVIDDGTKPTGDMVKIARAGATIVDTGHRSPKDAALIVRASKRG
jgi:hypothetical protein